ncbi:MAG TPA: hypothetical protein VLQ79_12790, partial [Myxococcaceae bacterium]|nr:hypothetical protein [Myxococcaceae bacterium]
MLSESQIQRYARQVLLHDVGERGQEALGAVRVELRLEGDAARAAAAYLRAGGTEVNVGDGSGEPWAGTPPLLGAPAARAIQVGPAPAVPTRDGVVLGSRPGTHVLWSMGEGCCPACIRT